MHRMAQTRMTSMKRCVMVCLLLLPLFLSGCCGLPLLRLQSSDGDNPESSFLQGPSGFLNNMSEVTVCGRTRLVQVVRFFTVLTMSDESSQSYLIIDFTPSSLVIYCGGSLRIRIDAEDNMDLWQHWCIYFAGNVPSRMCINGKIITQFGGVYAKPDIPENSPLVIGASTSQRLVAEVADIQIYDHELSEEHMKLYMNCSVPENSPEPILTLLSDQLMAMGSAQLSNISEEKICKSQEFTMIMTEEAGTFKEAVRWCSAFGGSLPLRANKNKHRQELLARGEKCSRFGDLIFWLGTGVNMTMDGRYTCMAVYVDISDYGDDWDRWPCYYDRCIACTFKTRPWMSLRGLCKGTKFDTNIYITRSENDSIVYRGESHINLWKKGDTWMMQSRIFKSLRAEMVTKIKAVVPLGRHVWTIEGDTCGKREAELVLTICSNDQFTCDDGSCIDKNLRCNLVLDCFDHSDERSCDWVIFSTGYSNRNPPPRLSSGPLPLMVHLEVMSVREFSLKTFTIAIDTLLSVTWKDQRLTFKNLQQSVWANKIDDTVLVWRPQTELKDARLGPVKFLHSSTAIYVSKYFCFSDRSSEDTECDGKDNDLVMQVRQVISLSCHFHLRMYPFDVQQCSIIIGVPDLHRKYGVLVRDTPAVKFSGERVLLEYRVMGIDMTPYVMSNNVTYMKVEMRFQNLYGYYIGNVFLPSLMMAGVCCLTFYFNHTNFTDRIMVSLTSLLVLTGLFAQTSDSMPKTSYLKLVDSWYLALISFDFCIIVSLVCLENLRQRHVHLSSGESRMKRFDKLAMVVSTFGLLAIIIIFMTLAHGGLTH